MTSFEPASSEGGQTHVRHYCRCHIVFVPKYRRKAIHGVLRKDIGVILRDVCRQQGIELIEGYAMKDHIPMLLMVSPNFSVSNTIGFLKGKSAIRVFRDYLQVKRNFIGRHFWARGYCVSMVGLDEQMIKTYIRNYNTSHTF